MRLSPSSFGFLRSMVMYALLMSLLLPQWWGGAFNSTTVAIVLAIYSILITVAHSLINAWDELAINWFFLRDVEALLKIDYSTQARLFGGRGKLMLNDEELIFMSYHRHLKSKIFTIALDNIDKVSFTHKSWGCLIYEYALEIRLKDDNNIFCFDLTDNPNDDWAVHLEEFIVKNRVSIR